MIVVANYGIIVKCDIEYDALFKTTSVKIYR